MKDKYRIFDRCNWSAWIVLLICISLSYLSWYTLNQQSEKNAQQQFELYVRDVLDSIESRMRQHEQILLGGVGLFDASDFVSRADWHNYVQRLNLARNYPGIQGVGYSQLIKPDELESHSAAIRQQGFPAYVVRPSGSRPLYTSIIYLEPFIDRNLAAFGYDMMSETTRSKAMHAAVDTNATTITHKLKLVQETHGKQQAGLLMYLPVYRKGMPLMSTRQRWDALQGYVYSPYRVDDLMAGILNNRLLMLDFSVYDGASENDEARIFVSTDEPRRDSVLMSSSRTLDVYGNVWTVRFNSRPEFEAGFYSSLNTVVLVLGCGISALLFMIISFLNLRRDNAETIALKMTASIREKSEELRKSESRIQAILEGAEHIIISTDTNGVIQSFNSAAERLLGYSAEEVVGKLTPAIFHVPEEVVRRAKELTDAGIPVEPGFEVFVALARNKPAGETREWTYVHKDGSTCSVSLTVTALHEDSGEISAYLGIATDITEQLLARKQHLDDEARLAAILDNVLDGIITINESGIVESFNKSAETIFGYQAGEVIGNNVKMLMPEPYHGEHDGYLHNYVSTGKKKIIGIGRQVVGRHRDGTTFPMDLAVSVMQLNNKRMFTGIVRDITERVKIEQMKSEFISTVSHELRTPLTSIRGSLALIVGGVLGELSVAFRPMLEIAHKNSERLILLVNDILDIEKIEAGKMDFYPETIELMPLVKQALEVNRAYATEYNVTYEFHSEGLDESGVKVHVDSNRLQQVLSNLLSNAAKFSPSGDRVEVGISCQGDVVRVCVSDHGTGIPEQFYNRIFSKFAQADSSDTRQKGGTGLGLSITKAIVEQMGGSIGFSSQPNVKTTFWVELPIFQDVVVNTSIANEAVSKRILICEDDQDVAAFLQLMLEQNGLSADIAKSAEQARQMLEQSDYSAMTLDLTLPGQDGVRLIRDLRANQKTASLPIVVVSANVDVGLQELKGDAFMVVDWLSKPIDRKHLLQALRRAMDSSRVVRPKVLHVEDDEDIFRVVKTIVDEFADVDNAITLLDARQLLENQRYDLVMLDINLPDGSGLDLLAELNSARPPIPTMVFSAQEMGACAIRQVGASLVKSRTDNDQLLATIRRMVGITEG